MTATDLRTRILAAQECRLLDLYDVRVTVEGPETPDARQVADQLRDMLTTIAPEPVPLLVSGRDRRHRRADAARQRRRA